MHSLLDRIRIGLSKEAPPSLMGDQDFGAFGTDIKGQYVPAAVLVPVVRRAEPGLLLTTRTAHLRNHAGQVSFPGGRVDAVDADPVAAALREANEEIGLAPEKVEVLGLASRYQTGTGFSIDPVVGVIDPDLNLVANPNEVADMFEVPLAFALDPANHRLNEVMWQGRLRRFYEIIWQDRRIWGATAGMLVNLTARLK